MTGLFDGGRRAAAGESLFVDRVRLAPPSTGTEAVRRGNIYSTGFVIRPGKGPERRKLGSVVVGGSLTPIMSHRNPKIGPAMTAIAAVIAFSSTPLLAQVAPEVSQPAPAAAQPVTIAPATAVPEIAPTAPAASEPSATVSDPLSPSTEPTTTAAKITKTSKSTTIRHTASVARPIKAAPPVARAAVAARVVAPVVAPVAAPAKTVDASPVPVVAIPSAPPPKVAATPPARDASAASNNLLPIAGAAGLVLLGLIGLWLVLRRRKLRRAAEAQEVEWQAEQAAVAAAEPAMTVEPALEAPVQADPLFAEPAFAPLAAEPAAVATVATSESAGLPSACDEAAPGSHVEAACDGPTDDNPSLSIKKRLKRAQFFDQREQLAAAGLAVPVESDAGLPDALLEEQAAAPSVREPA